MKKINVLIIGFGKIGKIRNRILSKDKRINKIYILDKNKKISKNKRIVNLKSIQKLNISAAFICVPTNLAHQFTIILLQKNINVFCEKPPASSLKNILKVKKVAIKSKAKLAYGFNHRQHESIKLSRKIIDSKVLGEILWIRCRYGKPIDNNYLDGWRGNSKESGGGILIDQGIHVLDLLILFLGKFVKIKSILTNNFLNKQMEDNAFVILQNKKKQTASMHSTLTQWRHIFSFEIFFQFGYITINGLKTPSGSYGNEEIIIGKNKKVPPKIEWVTLNKKIFKIDHSFKIEINNFLNAIIYNKKIESGNINDAVNVMELLNKIYIQNNI
jgi:1,5-anhydro-D-fructose reductase (1,5-anhydro-D-mannitol-forming)